MPGRARLDLYVFSRILAGDHPSPGRSSWLHPKAGLNPPADGEAEGRTEFGGRVKVEYSVSFGDSAKASRLH